MSSLFEWLVENEAALSSLAATAVLFGFVASPLGAGLRGLVRRWALSSAGFVEGSAATTPNTVDIPKALEPEADRPSIAVLPFVPTSDDKDSEIFADGMTDDVITALGRVHGFFVISSNSTFAYKGVALDTRQIGRELNVRYVVEGRLQRSGKKVRVNAKLVETRSGEQIWAERFEGDTSDLFGLQDEITRSIVGQLQPELLQAEWRRAVTAPTDSIDAWTLVHSARMIAFAGMTQATLGDAKRMAEAALEKDPDYAYAHALIAEMTTYPVAMGWSDDPEADRKLAAFHAHRALELDRDNPQVLASLGGHNFFIGNPHEAQLQLERSCAINPNDAFAQAMHSASLGFVGRGEEGLEKLASAFLLSPHDPRNYVLLMYLGWVHLSLERYEDAEKAFSQSVELHDEFAFSWWGLAMAQGMLSRLGEAELSLQKLQHLAPRLDLESVRSVYRNYMGNPTDQRTALIDRQIDSLRDIWPSDDEASG